MPKITFNSDILRDLKKITGIESATEIARKLTCSRDTLSIVMRDGDCRLTLLIEICNVYHLDFKRMFQKVKSVESAQEKSIPCDIVIKDHYVPVFLADRELIKKYNLLSPRTRVSNFVTLLNEQPDLMDRVIGYGYKKTEERSKWRFNDALWDALPILLNKKKTFIGLDSGLTRDVYTKTKSARDIAVCNLVKVCNAHNIPTLSFFVKDGEDAIPNDFPPVDAPQSTLHLERIEKIVPYGCTNPVTMVQLGHDLKCDRRTIDNYATGKNDMYASFFCKICNTYDLNPSFFFCDDSIANAEVVQKHKASREAKLLKTIEQLQLKLRTLEQENLHLKRMLNM